MSFFDKFKKNPNTNNANNNFQPQPTFGQGGQTFQPQPTFGQGGQTFQPKDTFNLSKQDADQVLSLRKDTLGFSLSKLNLNGLKSRVIVIFDISGSTRNYFRNGSMQNIVDRVLPLALQFDDNGELDTYVFSTDYKRMPSISINNYYGYIEREILNRQDSVFWHNTKYAPVMKDVYQKFVVEEPSNIPTYVLFITDGANDDRRETTNIITQLANHNIFWEFVGIGDEEFEYLQKLDDLQGRRVDNANFMPINDLSELSDQDLYDRLLQEYPQWIQAARRANILR